MMYGLKSPHEPAHKPALALWVENEIQVLQNNTGVLQARKVGQYQGLRE